MMTYIWLLTKSHLHKNKGQSLSLLLIIILAGILMNLGLMVGLHYNQSFDQRAKDLNSADVIIALQKKDPKYISSFEQKLYTDKLSSQIEKQSILYLSGECQYNQDETTKQFAIMNAQSKYQISQISYVEKSKTSYNNPIYLPYLFKTGGNYELGDTFHLRVFSNDGQEEKFSYQVAGFYEETMLATLNSTTTGLILEDAQYQQLSKAFTHTLDAYMYHIQLTDPSLAEVYTTKHTPDVNRSTTLYDCVFYDTIKMARTITSSIGSLLIIAFAFILASISVIVIKFRISHSIEEDMQNIGALKAIGYTGKDIVKSLLLQFLIITIIGSFLGIICSYALLPLLSQMFAIQTGIIWNQGFDIFSSSLTISLLLVLTICVALFSAQKARHLQPIQALRSGLSTHNFKHNIFPLDSFPGNLHILLAGKTFVQSFKQNLFVGMIVASISFAALFASAMYDNISVKFDKFLEYTVGELFDVQLYIKNPAHLMQTKVLLETFPEVRKVIDYNIEYLKTDEGASVICYATEDYANYDNQDILYQGRFPKHTNEVAIGGLLSQSFHKQIGDTITLIKGDNQQEYLITGLIQGSNFMGHDAAMTNDAYQALSPYHQQSTLNVYLNDNINIDDFIQMIKDKYPDTFISVVNNMKTITASMGTYREIVSMLVIVIAFVTAVIIALTLYLVMKTSLTRRKRHLGIQKALGYTTSQLVLQNALSLLPALLIGSLLGSITAYYTINPILSLLFSSIGIMKVNFEIIPTIFLILNFIIIFFGFIISIFVALRIRKITPYSLMSH